MSLVFFISISNTVASQFDAYDDYEELDLDDKHFLNPHSMNIEKRGILEHLKAANLMKRDYINRFITYIKKKFEVPKDKVYNDKIWMNRFG